MMNLVSGEPNLVRKSMEFNCGSKRGEMLCQRWQCKCCPGVTVGEVQLPFPLYVPSWDLGTKSTR